VDHVKSDKVTRAAVFFALVALAVAVRLISETPNFNAVIATSLFAGFYFRNRLTAICVPLLTMAISDQFLGGYARNVMIAVYASLLIPIVWRTMLRGQLSPARLVLGSMASSMAFYLLTNGMVWYTWYPHTGEALVRCYTVALPFFRNALVSDLLFTASLFGAYSLVARPAVAPARIATSAV
jgi:hypothetical protein